MVAVAVVLCRSANRLSLNNVTLVLSHMDVEEFLYKATIYQIRPAGFTEQLQVRGLQQQAYVGPLWWSALHKIVLNKKTQGYQ
jgi:hypothetical protein